MEVEKFDKAIELSRRIKRLTKRDIEGFEDVDWYIFDGYSREIIGFDIMDNFEENCIIILKNMRDKKLKELEKEFSEL